MPLSLKSLATWPSRWLTPLGRWVDALAPSVCDEAWAKGAAEGWAPSKPGAYCGRCGATLPTMDAPGCAACLTRSPPWDRVLRLGAYEAPLSSWIVAMKFQGEWSWAPRLGLELAKAALAQAAAQGPGLPIEPGQALGARWAVVPTPMPWLRRWRRGFNQSQLMAKAFAQASGATLAPVLRRTGYRPPQTMVAISERHRNAAGAFALAGQVDLRGWDVWLIDDVSTTGATAKACATLLRKAGAASVRLAIAAVAEGHAR